MDVVCSYFELDPRVLVGHLEYPRAAWEKHYPSDLCVKIDHVIRDYYENKYLWESGGDLTSPFDEHAGHSFRFYYEGAGLSVIPGGSAIKTNGMSPSNPEVPSLSHTLQCSYS